MVLKVKEFQNACKSILEAVDTTTVSVVNETLALKVQDKTLLLQVTNNEYFVCVKLPVDTDEEFKATVSAKLFLSLVSKITTDEIKLDTKDNALLLKANGTYKFPMIYSGVNNDLLEISPIVINNKTAEFPISSDILISILDYNSKELTKGYITRPIQKMYYVDEQGCITFTTGACVNSFTLPQPIKVLLNNKLVKLFKLFEGTSGQDIKFSLGYDEENGFTITKVKFESPTISITAKLSSDDTMLAAVPHQTIRSIATSNYTYSVDIDRGTLLAAINRLLLFTSRDDEVKNCGIFRFTYDSVYIKDYGNSSAESVKYEVECEQLNGKEYECMLDLSDVKATLDCCYEKYLTFHFGDARATVIARGNISNIISELHFTNYDK